MVRAGEASTALYIVATGEASVEVDGREIARVKEGDFFGEMAFLTGTARMATVRTGGTALEVIEVDEASLRALLEDHTEMAEHLAEKMAARQLEGEMLRDETGALMSPAVVVTQFRRRLLRFVGLSNS